ncbi:hypothetical protein V8C86DRAFT_3128302 [Haematococcus lacustris]
MSYEHDNRGMTAGRHPAAHPGLACVPEVDAAQLSYSQFVERFLAPNLPVLLKGAASHWRSSSEWVDPCGQPDLQALLAAAGPSATVSVTDCWQPGSEPQCLTCSLAQYAAWWADMRQQRQQQQQQQQQQQDAAKQQQSQPSPEQQQPAQQQQQLRQEAQQPQTEPASCPCEQPALPSALPSGGCWYLKDWHFTALRPQDAVYRVPPILEDDWLNFYYDWLASPPGDCHLPAAMEQGALELDPRKLRGRQGQGLEQGQGAAAGVLGCGERDYRFVYLGPQGSWTPLHADVLRSFSWSANVAGCKSWLLLPPEHTHLVYDGHQRSSAWHWGGDCSPEAQLGRAGAAGQHADADPDPDPDPAHDGTSFRPDSAPPDGRQRQGVGQGQGQGQREEELDTAFPGLPSARSRLLQCIQGAGDVMFVPCGWHHTVVNLADTLSINHNWMNAHSLPWTVALLTSRSAQAAADIMDCKSFCSSPGEWGRLVERNLQADSGWHLGDAAHFCTVMAHHFMRHLKHDPAPAPATPIAAPAAAVVAVAGGAAGEVEEGTGRVTEALGVVGGLVGAAESMSAPTAVPAEEEVAGMAPSAPAIAYSPSHLANWVHPDRSQCMFALARLAAALENLTAAAQRLDLVEPCGGAAGPDALDPRPWSHSRTAASLAAIRQILSSHADLDAAGRKQLSCSAGGLTS